MMLRDKVALVTGSSRGIGAAIAKLFAREGAFVAVHGRDVTALERVCHDIERDGGKAIQVVGDVTHAADVEAMRRQVEEALGPVHILVANAGANLSNPHVPVEEITEDAWRATIDANLTATFLCIKTFLPAMKQLGRGNIITMSSAAARRPSPLSPIPYSAAKAGIQLLTQQVAAQAGPHGVRVNCIAPETILTERNAERIPAGVQTKLVDEHPVRRLGTPDDVAQAALYFASDASGWISGVILDVAGGAVMR